MKKNKLPSLITILVLSLITIVAWVGFSIYRAFSQTTPPDVPSNVSASLDPTLDTTEINQIETKLFFSGSQIPNITAAPSPTATAKPVNISTPQASPSATPLTVATASASPTATP